jgi:hypothetical protein
MQPLDRDNAQIRRDAAAMLAATLHQRVENGELQTRMRLLREADQAVRRRARLGGRAEGAPSVHERLTFVRADGATARVGGEDARAISDALWELGPLAAAATAAASIVGPTKTRPELREPVQFTEREGEALGRASDGRVSWSLG